MIDSIPEPCLCGDPYCPSCFPGSVESNVVDDIAEAMTLLRERMDRTDYDSFWLDAMIQSDHDKTLERIFNQVHDDDHLELGRQVAELRDSLRKEFVESVDTEQYGFTYNKLAKESQ